MLETLLRRDQTDSLPEAAMTGNNVINHFENATSKRRSMRDRTLLLRFFGDCWRTTSQVIAKVAT
jgi:hypothetical protein